MKALLGGQSRFSFITQSIHTLPHIQKVHFFIFFFMHDLKSERKSKGIEDLLFSVKNKRKQNNMKDNTLFCVIYYFMEKRKKMLGRRCSHIFVSLNSLLCLESEK